MDNILETVRGYLLENFVAGEDAGSLSNDTDLKRTGVLDSLSTLRLVSFLEERFDFEFTPEELTTENLASLASIDRLVRAKLEARI